MTQGPPSAYDDVTENFYTNCVGLACFTVLLWDHIITFADEVEYVWLGGKGLYFALFIALRYLTPCMFAINLHAYFSPHWTFELCNRFVRFEGFATAFAIIVVNVMMLIRVHALYLKNKLITATLSTIILAETGLHIWLISSKAEAVRHNDASGVHACTMIFEPSLSTAAAATAWIPLLYDTIVFGLTAYKALYEFKPRSGFILKQVFSGGVLYYSVIFVVTLILTLMIPLAPPGLKNITAQSEQLMTVVMMSRITIDLKKVGRNPPKAYKHVIVPQV